MSYFKYMLDILKSEGNFVIKFVALTLKFYLCIAIISKESQKRIIGGGGQVQFCPILSNFVQLIFVHTLQKVG